MPALRAEYTIAQLNIAAFPWMDDRSKHRLVRSLERVLGHREQVIKATAADLHQLGIPVVRVKTTTRKKDDALEA